jgi:hypothetical protein
VDEKGLGYCACSFPSIGQYLLVMSTYGFLELGTLYRFLEDSVKGLACGLSLVEFTHCFGFNLWLSDNSNDVYI